MPFLNSADRGNSGSQPTPPPALQRFPREREISWSPVGQHSQELRRLLQILIGLGITHDIPRPRDEKFVKRVACRMRRVHENSSAVDGACRLMLIEEIFQILQGLSGY